ncbi:hypothetical protein ACFL54_06015 [Planctomycetota bacterium]
MIKIHTIPLALILLLTILICPVPAMQRIPPPGVDICQWQVVYCLEWEV